MRLHLGLRSSVEKICSPELGRMCKLSSDLKEAQAASRSWKRSCFVWSSYVVSVCLFLSLCVPAGVACHLTLVATTINAGVLGR